MGDKIYSDFEVIRAFKDLENGLTPEKCQEIDEKVKRFDERAVQESFSFSNEKKSLLKDVDRIDELELLSLDNKRYLAHIYMRLNEAMTTYVRNYVDDKQFTNWDLTNEACNLDAILSEKEYKFYAFKYYNLIKDSLWKNDYNMLLDAVCASEQLCSMH